VALLRAAGALEQLKLNDDEAASGQYEDLVNVKVIRTALQNAASIASLMLTTEAMICEVVDATGRE
jgi:chaperonin GroEL (HSP60 family)